MTSLIVKYFPEFSQDKLDSFQKLIELYVEWNSKVNLVSRQDIENLEVRHILHSLALLKINPQAFFAASSVMDIGTGGGLPGIPLAIALPEVNFQLIDGSAKKIKVVNDLIEQLQLKNIKAQQIRAEDWPGPKFDFIVTRAVASLKKLQEYNQKINEDSSLATLYAWKGGDLSQEISDLGRKFKVSLQDLSQCFSEEFFETKKLLTVSPK